MSEEVTQNSGVVENQAETGSITVEISDSSVKYDTNLSAPEVVFWLKIVEEMIVQKVMSGEDE